MGLDNFKQDNNQPDQEQYHQNPKLDKEKLYEPHICPACGEKAEHMMGIQYRCTTSLDDCEVMYYMTWD